MESDVTVIVALASTIILVVATFGIAMSNLKLTNNTEKFRYGNLIINLQDKLSTAILLEQEIINKHSIWKFTEEDVLESSKMIESFVISYLNITNVIAHLFVMEKSTLGKNNKERFEFYIAYAQKLLDVKNSSIDDNQYKYCQYIKQCVDKYDMKSDKTIPDP